MIIGFVVKNYRWFIGVIFTALFFSSCAPSAVPQENNIPRRSIYSQQPVNQAPSYYYQQRPPVQQYYQQGYGGYPQQQAPASRYYTNPYDFPPQNSYPYYDTDQYYSRPYGNDVNDNYAPGSSNDMKY